MKTIYKDKKKDEPNRSNIWDQRWSTGMDVVKKKSGWELSRPESNEYETAKGLFTKNQNRQNEKQRCVEINVKITINYWSKKTKKESYSC